MLSTCLFFRFSENLVKNCGENQKFPLLPITNVVLGHVAIVSISHNDQPPPPPPTPHPLFLNNPDLGIGFSSTDPKNRIFPWTPKMFHP